MLIISRHKDEEFLIGDDIVVTLVDTRVNKARVGITAPRDVGVNRAEHGRDYKSTGGDGSGMLVISRSRRQKILIGETVTVIVLEFRGNKVRFGIDAPKDVKVYRREVFDDRKRADDAGTS